MEIWEYSHLELMVRTLKNSAIKTDNPLKGPLIVLYETILGYNPDDNDTSEDQETSNAS